MSEVFELKLQLAPGNGGHSGEARYEPNSVFGPRVRPDLTPKISTRTHFGNCSCVRGICVLMFIFNST